MPSDGTQMNGSGDTIVADPSKTVITNSGAHGHGYGYGGYGHGGQGDHFWQSQAEAIERMNGVELAVEKTSAAGVTTTEKTAAAVALAVERFANLQRTDAIAFANQARTDAFVNYNGIQVAIEKTAAAGLLEATKNAAATALASAVTTAAIQASIAECCCELKELVRAENGATRDLINANRVRALELQLLSVLPVARVGTVIG